MPRAEVGSTKYLSNKMKAKGLQRLRWYCQVCEKQCRDENGFKCHTQSESHVRQMLIVGEDAKQHVDGFSNTFKSDFLSLLRTSHGEKKINANHFYQEYISNKEHIHMNATRWISLSEFVKYLGREGLVRVEEGEKGFFISYVDSSPEALRRQELLKKKERMDRGDEEREQRAIKEQIERAKREAERSGKMAGEQEQDEEARALKRENDSEKIKLDLGSAVASVKEETVTKSISPTFTTPPSPTNSNKLTVTPTLPLTVTTKPPTTNPLKPVKKKNVFAAASKKKSPAITPSSTTTDTQKRPMSEAERIMKEELERKRIRSSGSRSENGNFSFKKQRVA